MQLAGNITNRLFDAAPATSVTPAVGMPVTEILWSDRNLWTVSQVVDARTAVIARDGQPHRTRTIARRRDGRWYERGARDGVVFALDVESPHFDAGF